MTPSTTDLALFLLDQALYVLKATSRKKMDPILQPYISPAIEELKKEKAALKNGVLKAHKMLKNAQNSGWDSSVPRVTDTFLTADMIMGGKLKK